VGSPYALTSLHRKEVLLTPRMRGRQSECACFYAVEPMQYVSGAAPRTHRRAVICSFLAWHRCFSTSLRRPHAITPSESLWVEPPPLKKSTRSQPYSLPHVPHIGLDWALACSSPMAGQTELKVPGRASRQTCARVQVSIRQTRAERFVISSPWPRVHCRSSSSMKRRSSSAVFQSSDYPQRFSL